MIQQLILNTLFACQPKVETETPEPKTAPPVLAEKQPDIKKPPVAQTTPVEQKTPSEVSGTAPSPITIVSEISSPKESDLEKKFHAGAVQLSHIPYPRTNFDDTQLCNNICSRVAVSMPNRLSNIENCQLELIENWESERQAFSWDTVDENNPIVGSVQCTADLSYVKRGRASISPTKTSKTDSSLGGYFAKAAQEEMTAVFAFQEMLSNLQHLGAPQVLLEGCKRAISDEKRHTVMMSNLAKQHGCTSASISIPKQQNVSLFALAKYNALTGCIQETWAAVLATHQADHTEHYAKLFQMIATDEVFHAQLSWDIQDWLMSQLSSAERMEIQSLMQRQLESIPLELEFRPELGEMSPEQQQRAWAALSEQIQSTDLLAIA